MKVKLMLAMGLVAMSSMASAQEAQTRANQEAAVQRDAAKHFSSVAPGVVKDSRTGLEWMRCSLGQDWSEPAKTCKGSVRKYTWQGALDIADKLNAVGGYAGRTNWRVPTVRELQSLRYCSNGFVSDRRDLQDGKGAVPSVCDTNSTLPTIAQAVFPNMDSAGIYHWSSSPVAGDAALAWFVYFNGGLVSGNYRGGYGAVCLVR